MEQQHTVMKIDPATGDPLPHPSHADQWREWYGKKKKIAWLFNPWTGTRRDAGDIGSDPLGRPIKPPRESLYAADKGAPLSTVDARYRDLLQRLGVQSHDGAVAEISKLREAHGLDA